MISSRDGAYPSFLSYALIKFKTSFWRFVRVNYCDFTNTKITGKAAKSSNILCFVFLTETGENGSGP